MNRSETHKLRFPTDINKNYLSMRERERKKSKPNKHKTTPALFD